MCYKAITRSNCSSLNIVKNGKTAQRKQRYLCKHCRRQFIRDYIYLGCDRAVCSLIVPLTMNIRVYNMEESKLTYKGPAISDPDIVNQVPKAYSELLNLVNGFIAFNGGLHVRGAILSPKWHSLRVAWTGDFALYRQYPALRETDIPFGQDYLGDQFILRDDIVYRLSGETGELESLQTGFNGFLKCAQEDPVNFLYLNPLLQFQSEGGVLEPGQLLNVLPPFIMKESEEGVSMRAIPMFDQIRFLADFSSQIAGAPNGTEVTMKVIIRPKGH